jgi:itaconyl-CoA hydratase
LLLFFKKEALALLRDTPMSKYGYLQIAPGRYRERFGLSFEDVHVGMRIGHRPGVDVSQRDSHLDAVDLINNAQLHYDSKYAASTEWQVPLSVSTMTVQRFMGMISRSWYRRRALLGIDRLALIGPVLGDATLYSESEVTAMRDGNDPDVGEVSLTVSGLNGDGQIIAQIECRIELYRAGRHYEDDSAAPIADEPRFTLYREREDGMFVEQTGLFFEDLAVGETFEHWPPRSITAAESRQSALRSLEINPRWHEAGDRAAPPGRPNAVWEPLVIGAVTALTTRTFGRVVANLGWTGITLPRPVAPGESLRAESTVTAVRDSSSRPHQGIATVETRAYGDDGDEVCRYVRALLIYRTGKGPYQAAGY